ncbi:kinase-like domain-containing protein [Gigaspora rosea]|uniref:Kinase-like domain-containing protein n=1 Tax=Gigaspora rosea TaxID=44941 RepID=A0A397W9H7_9GLOM|nr:kinase-like domain-containing protein [Gigaspora rosea]
MSNFLNGQCAKCNDYNSSRVWCSKCDNKLLTKGWSSGDLEVDNCIKPFQLQTLSYKDAIEWIPFDKLNNIQKIGEGGNGIVYSAIWLDGIRVVRGYSDIKPKCVRQRKPSSMVALKTLHGSSTSECLEEFENLMECRIKGIGLMIYGLTYNMKTNKYLIVYQFANKGNLHEYLVSNFKEFKWESKLEQLLYISYDLSQIHEAGFTHKDIHSGNILLHLDDNPLLNRLYSYIADLGLSRRKNGHGSKKVHGVLRYIAPEVLISGQFTQASDIYGLGAIMPEISTGKRPFYDISDEEIPNMTLNGSLPEFAPETPDCYIELAKKCMNSDPLKRPSAKTVSLELFHLHWIISKPSKTIEEFEIKKKFLYSDEINKKSTTNLIDHSNFTDTSKIIDTPKTEGKYRI